MATGVIVVELSLGEILRIVETLLTAAGLVFSC